MRYQDAGVTTPRFRDDIQGLRAIAVLSVLLFHAFPTAIPGGYVGVDIFFVISGYLITGIIYKSLEQGGFSIADFYRRRIRRIVPALVVVVAATIGFGYFALSPKQYSALSVSAIASLLSVSNIYFWKTTGYFETSAELRPLLHTWSLGVEEQFYIFLPLLMYVVYRFRRALLVPVLLACFVASLVVSELMVDRAATAAYYLLHSRAFELLIGSLLAVAGHHLPASRRVREAGAVIGLGMVLFALFAFSEHTRFPGLNALIPCVGAALLIHAGRPDGLPLVTRLIANPPFRYLGDISYSLYLWHWPVLAFARNEFGIELPVQVAAACVVISIVLSILSYRFVEQPFMHASLRATPLLTGGLGAIAVLALLISPIYLTKGLPARFSGETLALFNGSNDFNPKRSQCHSGGGLPIPFRANCVFGDTSKTPSTVVWGDSHGAEISYQLGSLVAGSGQSVMEITASACPPALGFAAPGRPHCVGHNQAVLDNLVASPDVRNVILAANGQEYLDQGAQGLAPALESTVKALTNAGKRVILIAQIPTFDFDPPQALGLAQSRGQDIRKIGIPQSSYRARSEKWNTVIAGLHKTYGAQIVDPSDILCDDHFCEIFRDGNGVLYFDKDHLSLKGSDLIAPTILATIQGKNGS